MNIDEPLEVTIECELHFLEHTLSLVKHESSADGVLVLENFNQSLMDGRTLPEPSHVNQQTLLFTA